MTTLLPTRRPMPAEWEQPGHVGDAELASYVDGRMTDAARSDVERHLAQCGKCRADLVAAAGVLAERPRRGWIRIMVPAAAAAALVLVWVGVTPRPTEDAHRAPTVTEAAPPAPLAPVGRTAEPLVMRWNGVPYADAYRVSLYDAAGSLLWETETPRTAAAPPPALELQPGASYFWRLEARVGRDRWVGSELVEFIPLTPDH